MTIFTKLSTTLNELTILIGKTPKGSQRDTLIEKRNELDRTAQALALKQLKDNDQVNQALAAAIADLDNVVSAAEAAVVEINKIGVAVQKVATTITKVTDALVSVGKVVALL